MSQHTAGRNGDAGSMASKRSRSESDPKSHRTTPEAIRETSFRPGKIFTYPLDKKDGNTPLVRRSVILEAHPAYSTCVQIKTYRRKGCVGLDEGIQKMHAAVYTDLNPSDTSQTEPFLRIPIRASRIDLIDSCNPRINYNEIHNLGHAERVRWVGEIHEDSLPVLLREYREVNKLEQLPSGSPQAGGPSSHTASTVKRSENHKDHVPQYEQQHSTVHVTELKERARADTQSSDNGQQTQQPNTIAKGHRRGVAQDAKAASSIPTSGPQNYWSRPRLAKAKTSGNGSTATAHRIGTLPKGPSPHPSAILAEQQNVQTDELSSCTVNDAKRTGAPVAQTQQPLSRLSVPEAQPEPEGKSAPEAPAILPQAHTAPAGRIIQGVRPVLETPAPLAQLAPLPPKSAAAGPGPVRRQPEPPGTAAPAAKEAPTTTGTLAGTVATAPQPLLSPPPLMPTPSSVLTVPTAAPSLPLPPPLASSGLAAVVTGQTDPPEPLDSQSLVELEPTVPSAPSFGEVSTTLVSSNSSKELGTTSTDRTIKFQDSRVEISQLEMMEVLSKLAEDVKVRNKLADGVKAINEKLMEMRKEQERRELFNPTMTPTPFPTQEIVTPLFYSLPPTYAPTQPSGDVAVPASGPTAPLEKQGDKGKGRMDDCAQENTHLANHQDHESSRCRGASSSKAPPKSKVHRSIEMRKTRYGRPSWDRALLDTGADANFISEGVAEELDLDLRPYWGHITCGNGSQESPKHIVDIFCSLETRPEQWFDHFIVMPNLHYGMILGKEAIFERGFYREDAEMMALFLTKGKLDQSMKQETERRGAENRHQEAQENERIRRDTLQRRAQSQTQSQSQTQAQAQAHNGQT